MYIEGNVDVMMTPRPPACSMALFKNRFAENHNNKKEREIIKHPPSTFRKRRMTNYTIGEKRGKCIRTQQQHLSWVIYRPNMWYCAMPYRRGATTFIVAEREQATGQPPLFLPDANEIEIIWARVESSRAD